MHGRSLQLCPTLRNPMDCSPPGSSVHGILQARTLAWVVMLFSRGSAQPREWTHVSYVSGTGRQVPECERHLGSPPLSGATLIQQIKQRKYYFCFKTKCCSIKDILQLSYTEKFCQHLTGFPCQEMFDIFQNALKQSTDCPYVKKKKEENLTLLF